MLKKETLIILLLCFITRLPQLSSDNLVLDGDECVEALMAKHLYEGKEIPLYFYGQAYGFSLVELLPISVNYFFFGISDLPVKLAMLLMWTLGIFFFYKTLLLINFKNTRIPFLITALFIFAPAWAVWSMKARGGYLSSFLICSIITYLLFNEHLNKKVLSWLATGFLIVVMYESQPLWLPGLLPILIYKLYTGGKWKFAFSVLTSMLFAVAGFWLLKRGITTCWQPQVFDFSADLWQTITDLPRRMFINLSGSYYLGHGINFNAATNTWAICFTAVIIIILITAPVFFIARKKDAMPLLLIFSFSVFFTISYLVFITDYAPRYLLPLLGFSLLLIAVAADTIPLKKVFSFAFIFFIMLGSYSLFSFKDFRFKVHTKENIIHLTDELLARNIHYVFCTDPLLQWEISYYSKEKIVARFINYNERYPPYITSVNNAFNTKAGEVAVAGYRNQRSPAWKEFTLVDDQFYFSLHPSSILLSNYGFGMSGHPDR